MTTAVRLLTVTEIAAVYHTERAAIYLLAHRKHWRRIKYGGRVYYDIADVDRDLGNAS